MTGKHRPDRPDIDADDPDRDPENLEPRDDRGVSHEYEGDPDADPENMNPGEDDADDR